MSEAAMKRLSLALAKPATAAIMGESIASTNPATENSLPCDIDKNKIYHRWHTENDAGLPSFSPNAYLVGADRAATFAVCRSLDLKIASPL
jgi:hypothetical protein